MSSQTSLFALACGDSYGAYFEYQGLSGEVFDVKSLPNRSLYYNITDDTKMAMILLKHYNVNKKLDKILLKKQYQKWALEEGDADGIGLHTKNVLINHSKDRDSQGNGALMRVIPFGLELIEDGYNFEEAIHLMNDDSSLTHQNDTIYMVNRLSLDLALNSVEILNKNIYKELLQRFHRGYSAWVLQSLYIVIEALKKDLTFLEGFKYIVSCGGDTDTNCAIYGAIRGFKEDITKTIKLDDFIPKGIQVKLNIKM